MNAGYIVFAGVAPHPPIMVPEVGREAIAEVRDSIAAMRELTGRIIASGAETVVLVSPHAPLDPRAFVAYDEEQLYGDFAGFRAREAKVEAPLDRELLAAIADSASEDGYEVVGIEGYGLDHGTAVPLYFLLRNGWRGRVVAFGYSFLPNEDHLRFGASIRRAVDRGGRPVALVASGDLSHRLKPDAPAGYNPEAYRFDEEVVESIRACSPERIATVDQNLRKLAGECGYRSLLVAIGATRELRKSCEVLSYEAPFGVGYMVAQMVNNGAAQKEPGAEEEREPRVERSGDELPALARQAVETFVREGRAIEAPREAAELLGRRAACFVSIKTKQGDLRGCIGTIEPVRETLAEELIANAISAATRDPRFPPVEPEELSRLRYSVDMLSEPEPARFEDLDPSIYGVIVADESGARRGLLLPDLEGVETASQQVEIAARKGGMAPGSALKLFRFRVRRFGEPAAELNLRTKEQTNGK